MGRWLQKIQKPQMAEPTKPTKSASVGSVGTPNLPFQKKQPTNDPLTDQQFGWLAAVASLLEVGTLHLIEGGFIDQQDLAEQLDADPLQVASLIRSNPDWYRRSSEPGSPAKALVRAQGTSSPTEIVEAPDGNET